MHTEERNNECIRVITEPPADAQQTLCMYRTRFSLAAHLIPSPRIGVAQAEFILSIPALLSEKAYLMGKKTIIVDKFISDIYRLRSHWRVDLTSTINNDGGHALV